MKSNSPQRENIFCFVLFSVHHTLSCRYLGLYIDEADFDDCDCSCYECWMLWKWEDGSPMTWFNWGHGEPDPGIGTAGRICKGGKWHELNNGHAFKYICEKGEHIPN